MTVGGLSFKAVCFEVVRALEVAKGIDVSTSFKLAVSKSRLKCGVFFFLVIFGLSVVIDMIRSI